MALYRGRFDFDRAVLNVRPDAAKFEEGTPAFPLIAGLGAAVKLLLEVGVDNIGAHIETRLDELESGLHDLGLQVGPRSSGRAGILTTPMDADPDALLAHLAEDGVQASVRRGHLRLSAHVYNNRHDTARAVDSLKRFLG